jgi:D-alanyl-D-alanine dipeptidase
MFNYIKLQKLRFETLLPYHLNDWRKVPIKENGEPLIQIPKEISFPFYSRKMKIVTDERMYLREGVLERIFFARSLLQKKYGLDLVVYDGWRSIELQENLFWYYMKMYTANKFGQKESFEELDTFTAIRSYFVSLLPEMQKEMIEANRPYVSWPSKSPTEPSPHSTGGSVDVWLFEKEVEMDLGVSFDCMEKTAGVFYHLNLFRKKFTSNDQQICRNRSKLILSMTSAGFSCYGPEFWHFNYGNQMDALVKGGIASYSYIEP